MSESIGGAGVVGKIHTAQRVAELEIDVARLIAELDEARGGDSTTGASRFLTIAVSTIDQAVSEVTQEAEEAVSRLRTDLEQSQTRGGRRPAGDRSRPCRGGTGDGRSATRAGGRSPVGHDAG